MNERKREATVKRDDYVRYLVKHAGLTYVQAEKVYSVLMRMFAQSIASRATINLARVGVIKPITLPPRKVTMGFKWVDGKREPTKRVYWLGLRTAYRLKLHRAFMLSHNLASLGR